MIVLLIAHRAEFRCFFNKMTFRKESFGYLSGDTCLIQTGSKDKLIRHILPGIKKLSKEFKDIQFLNLGFAAVLNRALPIGTIVEAGLCYQPDTGEEIQLPKSGLALHRVGCMTIREAGEAVHPPQKKYSVNIVDMELFFLAEEARSLSLPLTSIKVVSDYYEDRVPAGRLIESAPPLCHKLYESYMSYKEKGNDLV